MKKKVVGKFEKIQKDEEGVKKEEEKKEEVVEETAEKVNEESNGNGVAVIPGDEFRKSVADLTSLIKRKIDAGQQVDLPDNDQIAKIAKDILAQQKKEAAAGDPSLRKGTSVGDDGHADDHNQAIEALLYKYSGWRDDTDREVDGMDILMKVDTRVMVDTPLLKKEQLAEIQKTADDVYILGTILSARNNDSYPNSYREVIQELHTFKSLQKQTAQIAKAMSAGSWLPTSFSSSLVELVRLELFVAGLFQTIPMPTRNFSLPVVGAGATGYRQAESTADSSTRLTASTPTTRAVTFVSDKVAARVLASSEVTEDSIIPILPWIRGEIVRAMAEAIEKAHISGDDSSSGQIDRVTDTTDARMLWKGLRRLSTTDIAGVTIAGGGAVTLAILRACRKTMGKYGVRPRDLAWITGPRGWNVFMNQTEVRTVDKYGPQAVVLAGELARYEDIPIIISDQYPENLNSTGTAGGAGSNADTMINLVHRPSFANGDRRSMTLKSDEDIQTDQVILVATERRDFQFMYLTSQVMVAGIVNPD